jgi:DNA polymerase-3 subunit delta'
MEGFPAWLTPAVATLESALAAERAPQALLIHGLPGTGRALLSAWLARRLLGLPADAAGPIVHPDFLAVAPDGPRQQTISVAQARELIDFVALTASARRKVAIVNPAEAMTANAANAILKTLEEPAGETVLVLVADSPGSLPPTIVSRCQRLRVATPSPADATAFLAATDPGVDWRPWLELAGGAPLAARALREFERDDRPPVLPGFAADLEQVVTREEGPVPVAARWARISPDLALRWLELRATAVIRQRLVPGAPAVALPAPLQKPGSGPNIAAWFEHIDRIRRAREQLGRGLNEELLIADLLLFWAGVAMGRRAA